MTRGNPDADAPGYCGAHHAVIHDEHCEHCIAEADAHHAVADILADVYAPHDGPVAHHDERAANIGAGLAGDPLPGAWRDLCGALVIRPLAVDLTPAGVTDLALRVLTAWVRETRWELDEAGVRRVLRDEYGAPARVAGRAA